MGYPSLHSPEYAVYLPKGVLLDALEWALSCLCMPLATHPGLASDPSGNSPFYGRSRLPTPEGMLSFCLPPHTHLPAAWHTSLLYQH